jgi:hypothetical protein
MSLAMVSDTDTDTDTAELRNDTLAAAAQVPGVPDWSANKLSQLDISYAPAPASTHASSTPSACRGRSWCRPAHPSPACPTTST